MILAYAVLMQATLTPDWSTILLGILGSVTVVLGVAGTAMKRMVDSHFNNLEDMRARIKSLETQENEHIHKIATLEEQQREVERSRAQVKQASVETIKEKDHQIAVLQQQIDQLSQQLAAIRQQLTEVTGNHQNVVTERDALQRQVRDHVQQVREQDGNIRQLRKEIQSVVAAQSVDHELWRAYELKLRERGADTAELKAIRETVQSQFVKPVHKPDDAGDDTR